MAKCGSCNYRPSGPDIDRVVRIWIVKQSIRPTSIAQELIEMAGNWSTHPAHVIYNRAGECCPQCGSRRWISASMPDVPPSNNGGLSSQKPGGLLKALGAVLSDGLRKTQ